MVGTDHTSNCERAPQYRLGFGKTVLALIEVAEIVQQKRLSGMMASTFSRIASEHLISGSASASRP